LLHHDSRPYQVAVDDTAQRFQRELDAKIAATRHTAEAVIDRVQRDVPTDRLASTHALRFQATDNRLVLGARGTGFEQPLHRHALAQLAERAGIPDVFVTRLLEKRWGAELLAENLDRIYSKSDERRLLVRSVHDEVRGVLSDCYRRLDSRAILESFAAACAAIGVVPIEGVAGDLRFCVRGILPVVFRPGDQEVVAFGIEISSSDFGLGALSVRCFLMRIACTNMARLREDLRQVHLGRRLDDAVSFSDRTYRLDTAAMASAVRDIVTMSLAPAKVNAMVAQLGEAMATQVDFKSALLALPKVGLLKTEVEAVRDVLLTGGFEQLPAGNTSYRLSNAISWIAKAAPTPERRLELEAVAGQMLLGTGSRRAREAA
jgi:hypothetical protein